MKFINMGIEESIPISSGFAPNCSKKLVSNTPLVMLEKTAAKTPSQVEALRLVRMADLEICGGTETSCVADSALVESISTAGADNVSTGSRSLNVQLIPTEAR